LEALLKLQTSEGLHAANKLTHRHVNFQQQIMKVKYAVQTMSSSVATALDVCRLIGLPEFAESSPTSEFIKLMDRLFDAMNSRPTGHGYKAPLRESNKIFWKSLFEKATDALLSLKVKVPQKNKPPKVVPLYSSKRGTCVKGLIACMRSLSLMMEEVVNKKDSGLV
jgi:hypothetical protein